MEEMTEMEQEQKEPRGFWKKHGSTVLMTAFLAVFALSLCFGLWKPVVVHQTSMYPTLLPGDYLFIVRTGSYERGDIVVFKSEALGEENLIKRVIAVGGDHLVITGGAVYLNDTLLQEPYLAAGLATEGDVDLVVGEGDFFLMGDNRTVSVDCRAFGPIPGSDILGEVNLRVYHKPSVF